MKLTAKQLRQIIQEELHRMQEDEVRPAGEERPGEPLDREKVEITKKLRELPAAFQAVLPQTGSLSIAKLADRLHKDEDFRNEFFSIVGDSDFEKSDTMLGRVEDFINKSSDILRAPAKVGKLVYLLSKHDLI
jgi:hypothetical protein